MCKESLRLLVAYDNAIQRFAAGLEALLVVRENASQEDYARLERSVDQEQVDSEVARIEMDTHCAKHGCSFSQGNRRLSESVSSTT